MMGVYSYTVSRFVPDPIRNEPVNIGVVVVDPDTGEAAHRFTSRMDSLKARCPGADIGTLSGVVKFIKIGRMPGGADVLADLSKRHRNLLQFTPPRAVEAPTLDGALQSAYATYVHHAVVSTTTVVRRACPQRSKTKILCEIDREMRRAGIGKKAVERRPRFEGQRGTFRPDRGLATEIAFVALHVIALVGRQKKALAEAKVLAIDFEDAREKKEDLECTAVVEKPAQDSDEAESYRQASGHLQDRGCKVVPHLGIRECIEEVKARIRGPGAAGRRGQQELAVHP